jgi:hypothetical protein
MITCATFPHAGDGLQQLDLMRPRLAGLGDHRVQLRHGLLDQVQPTQHRAGQPGMVGVEMAGQRLRQVRDLAPHPTLRRIGEPQRVRFAVDHRGQNRPGRHRLQTRRHRGDQADRLLYTSSNLPGHRRLGAGRTRTGIAK